MPGRASEEFRLRGVREALFDDGVQEVGLRGVLAAWATRTPSPAGPPLRVASHRAWLQSAQAHAGPRDQKPTPTLFFTQQRDDLYLNPHASRTRRASGSRGEVAQRYSTAS